MYNKDNAYREEREFFDKVVEKHGEVWWGSDTPAGRVRLQRKAEVLSKTLCDSKKYFILEVGCGTGAFSQYIVSRINF
ncbi:MAG: class I SAM-dependent methyltransferase [Candidatus Omnitrophota bacterium]|nr:class I SAM-dependent methyltransferase [Candidatus Omnitrophota bacterium]